MKYTIKTIADEGTPYEKVRETEFASAIEAVNYYNGITDYGFASYRYTVIFTEPNGDMYHKSFPAHASGESVRFEERTIRYQVVS